MDIFSFHAQKYLPSKRIVVIFGGLTTIDASNRRASIQDESMCIDPFNKNIWKLRFNEDPEDAKLHLSETACVVTPNDDLLFFGGYNTQEVFERRNENKCSQIGMHS